MKMETCHMAEHYREEGVPKFNVGATSLLTHPVR